MHNLKTLDSNTLATVVGGEQPMGNLTSREGVRDLNSKVFSDCFRNGGSYIGCDAFAKQTEAFVSSGMPRARAGEVPVVTGTAWQHWQNLGR